MWVRRDMRFVWYLLDRMVRRGDLTVTGPDGRSRRFGDGSLPRAAIRFNRTPGPRLLFVPTLVFGEAYMNGDLTVTDGDVYDLIAIGQMNRSGAGRSGVPERWGEHGRRLLRRVQQFNPAGRARRNAAHHYDLSDRLYELFLDADRQYSCAYFQSPVDTLEMAQDQKKRHLMAKLLPASGQRVLDIGCGWGGLALTIARRTGARVLGITLSQEQLAVARRRAAAAGLADRVRFDLLDYRHLTGQFDRIVSVGMFEHVGVAYYQAFFEKIRSLLTDTGVAVVHSIGRFGCPGTTDPWIAKYIFPGGYIPALSETLPAVERSGLYPTDLEILRLHYAETLRHWRRRFRVHRAKVADLYDERFCRMWEFYLAGAELGFRQGRHMVFQLQLAKSLDTVPLNRDYITDYERSHPAVPIPEDRPSVVALS